MEAAEHWNRHDRPGVMGARWIGAFLSREMSSYAVVVIRIEFENCAHEVIDAFAANRADEGFEISVVLSESRLIVKVVWVVFG
jgi:hypothetical protein